MAAQTIQSNIKHHTYDNMNNYALFVGGTNVIHDVLQCYDPLRTGYGRLFMVRKPVFLEKFFEGSASNPLNKFKHILEYGNTSVQGIQDPSVNFESVTGGYVGNSFEIPTVAQDGTNSLTVKVYEFSGSPVREVIHSWINGTTDLLTGLTHYNGVDSGIARIQANQTAEFIYVSTDSTGEAVEYACLFANCFPKGINNDVYNYEAGQHQLVQTDIEFTCTKYESVQINAVAAKLLEKYKVITNSLNFYSGYSTADTIKDESGNTRANDLGGTVNPKAYDEKTGKIREYTGSGANREWVNN